MIEVTRKTETPMCIFTVYEDDGKEFVHCLFKDAYHPVNRSLFKISGQPRNVQEAE